jgi:hypothetical protein
MQPAGDIMKPSFTLLPLLLAIFVLSPGAVLIDMLVAIQPRALT